MNKSNSPSQSKTNLETKGDIMKKLTTPAVVIPSVFIAIAIAMTGYLYWTKTQIESNAAQFELMVEDLGFNPEVVTKLSDAKVEVETVMANPSTFADDEKISTLQEKIRKGLEEEEKVYVKTRYLTSFLAANETYEKSGIHSEQWETFSAQTIEMTYQNRLAWIAELKKIDDRTKNLFDVPKDFKVTEVQTDPSKASPHLGKKLLMHTKTARDVINDVATIKQP